MIIFLHQIKPVCLPTFASSSVASNTDIFVAGYGSAGSEYFLVIKVIKEAN